MDWYWTKPHESSKSAWHNGGTTLLRGTQFLVCHDTTLSVDRSVAMVFQKGTKWRAVAHDATYHRDFDTVEEARAVVLAHVRLS